MKKIILGLMSFALIFSFAGFADAATTTVITASSQAGWTFNPDPTNATLYEFNEDTFSIGTGSLYVKPISATGAHKFIGAKTMGSLVSDFNSISYDFKIAGSGDMFDANQFYLNIYTNLPSSTTFYDCRFDYVPTLGSITNFTTATFNATDTPTNVGDKPDAFTCPGTLAGMPTESTVKFFALNLGDTSTNDAGLAGYFDKVVVDLDSIVTTYDFESDTDNDGVVDGSDECPGTIPDANSSGVVQNFKETLVNPAYKEWGQNRWLWTSDGWRQKFSSGKKPVTPIYKPGTQNTYGCSAVQILEKLNSELGNVMNGHWKFGLSSSVLEEFSKDMSDGVLDGRYYVETVTVPANKSTDTLSVNPLSNGVTFILKAFGTADAGDGIQFDARYSFRTPTSVSWTDAVSTYEIPYGVTLLDLFFNGSTPWGAYDSSHVYEYQTVGDGNNAAFKIYDVYYPNNTGNLTVDIYAQI